MESAVLVDVTRADMSGLIDSHIAMIAYARGVEVPEVPINWPEEP
jgi:hypothetical protein